MDVNAITEYYNGMNEDDELHATENPERRDAKDCSLEDPIIISFCFCPGELFSSAKSASSPQKTDKTSLQSLGE
jgi:hypothetical protein